MIEVYKFNDVVILVKYTNKISFGPPFEIFCPVMSLTKV
jgi:hypothetical protein